MRKKLFHSLQFTHKGECNRRRESQVQNHTLTHTVRRHQKDHPLMDEFLPSSSICTFDIPLRKLYIFVSTLEYHWNTSNWILTYSASATKFHFHFCVHIFFVLFANSNVVMLVCTKNTAFSTEYVWVLIRKRRTRKVCLFSFLFCFFLFKRPQLSLSLFRAREKERKEDDIKISEKIEWVLET